MSKYCSIGYLASLIANLSRVVILIIAIVYQVFTVVGTLHILSLMLTILCIEVFVTPFLKAKETLRLREVR